MNQFDKEIIHKVVMAYYKWRDEPCKRHLDILNNLMDNVYDIVYQDIKKHDKQDVSAIVDEANKRVCNTIDEAMSAEETEVSVDCDDIEKITVGKQLLREQEKQDGKNSDDTSTSVI